MSIPRLAFKIAAELIEQQMLEQQMEPADPEPAPKIVSTTGGREL
jgi:hypothetical protein